MLTLTKNAHPIQNIGLVDRVIRLLIGAALIGTSYFYVAHLHQMVEVWATWGTYAILIAIYPIMTGMLGFDPLYTLFHVRTCGDTGRHQSGTLPYQMVTMFGHTPKYTEFDGERSLGSTHEEPIEHPHHKVWRVEQDPEIYPDERAWHGFFAGQETRRQAMGKAATATTA
jgi:hypothetical protein